MCMPTSAIATPAVVPCRLVQNALALKVVPKARQLVINTPEPMHTIRLPSSASSQNHMNGDDQRLKASSSLSNDPLPVQGEVEEQRDARRNAEPHGG